MDALLQGQEPLFTILNLEDVSDGVILHRVDLPLPHHPSHVD